MANVKVGELKVGERFVHKGNLWIKTDKHVVFRQNFPYCVGYYTGKLLPFSNDVTVEKV